MISHYDQQVVVNIHSALHYYTLDCHHLSKEHLISVAIYFTCPIYHNHSVTTLFMLVKHDMSVRLPDSPGLPTSKDGQVAKNTSSNHATTLYSSYLNSPDADFNCDAFGTYVPHQII